MSADAPRPADVWASGAAYEPYVGRWSRLVAREFLAWLAVPPGRRWLDVGCGTGALSQTIVSETSPGGVKGVDASAGYVAFARQQVRDARVQFEVADARALAEQPASYDAVVSGLVLNFVAQPALMVAEMARVARRHLLVSVPREPLWRGLNMARGSYWGALGNTPGHINHWSKRSFVSMLSRHGDVEVKRSPFPWTMLLVRLPGAE